jgi:uncharacterized metal-binding protein (TIGR02443 family)
MKKNQRFVAGAVCPQCDEMDSLLLDMIDQSIACVDCGYQQTESERDAEYTARQDEPVKKVIPKKVDVSNIIRVTNIKD